MAACADVLPERAAAQAAEFGVPRVCSVSELLYDPAIEMVVNLTIPGAHAEVAAAAIASGKSVYNEKPLAIRREDGQRLLAAAKAQSVLVGGAPDTFMGGGPMFDMGPYYLTALVSLLGPVRRVTGSARITFPERTITSQPKAGTRMAVEVPTHIAGVMDFAGGAVGTIVTSFDVWAAQVPFTEIYGSEGSLRAGAWRSCRPNLPGRSRRSWVPPALAHPPC